MPVSNRLLAPEDELVGDKVAAEILGICNYRTLSNWRANGQHNDLAYLRIGRSIRYRVGDLLDFRKRHTVGGAKIVEPVIEHAAFPASTQAQATAPNTAQTVMVSEAPTAPTTNNSAQLLQLQKTSGHVFRPSDLARKQMSL